MNTSQPYKVLLLGITLTALGLCQLPTILTFKSSLLPLKGTLSSAKTYITRVSNTNRYGHESKSNISELIFYLNEYPHRYRMSENIGDLYINKDYNRIARGLRAADSVTVWIKKEEFGWEEPTVFQIDKDDTKTLLDFETVRTASGPLTAFLLLMGAASIGFFLWKAFPERMKAWVGTLRSN